MNTSFSRLSAVGGADVVDGSSRNGLRTKLLNVPATELIPTFIVWAVLSMTLPVFSATPLNTLYALFARESREDDARFPADEMTLLSAS